jgi:HlyD family secretion protein
VQFGVLLGVLLLLVLAFRPDPLRVDLGPVTRGPLRVTVNAEGKTRLRQRFVISAPVAGRLERLTLREGDTVTQDMVVAQIDPLASDTAVREAQGRLAEWYAQRAGVATLRPKQAALAQGRARVATAQAAQRKAEARLEQVRAALEHARRDYQRAVRMETSGTISREARETSQLNEITRTKEYDAAVLEVRGGAAEVVGARAALAMVEAQQRDPDYLLDVYNARITSAEAELARLRDAATRTEIRTPSAGRVLRVLQEDERMVTAGTPLLAVGDVTHLELVVDVLSTDAVRIQPGALMLLERWGGGSTLQARVRLIEPAAFTKISALGIEEQRVNIIADFVDPPHALGDGYRVEARIVVWESAEVTLVPASALFRCRESWCVFVAVQEKAQRRVVDLGQRSDLVAEVLQGLRPGELVVLHPAEQLEEGLRIRPREAAGL